MHQSDGAGCVSRKGCREDRLSCSSVHNSAKPDLGCGELQLCLNKPPHLHASFLKAPCALTWGPAEKCSFSWRSQLILYNCIQLDNHLRPGLANPYSRGQVVFSVCWPACPCHLTRGAEAAKASAERTGHDRVRRHRSPGSRRTPQSPGHCPVGRRLGS